MNEKPIPDHISAVTNSPFYFPGASRVGVIFNDVLRRDVIEACVSEGWIIPFKRNFKGEPVRVGGSWVPLMKIKGKVQLFWR